MIIHTTKRSAFFVKVAVVVLAILAGLPALGPTLLLQYDPCPGADARSGGMGAEEGRGCCCGGAGQCGCHVRQGGPPLEEGGVSALPEVRQERQSPDGAMAVSSGDTHVPGLIEGDSPAWTLARGPSGPRYLLNLNILC